MHDSWADELWRLSLVLTAGLLVGLLWEQVAYSMLGCLVVYKLWNLLPLQRRVRWLNNPKPQATGYVQGTWADILAKVQRQFNQHRRREAELNRYLDEFRASAAALPDAAVVLGTAS